MNPNLAAEGVAYRFKPGQSGNPGGGSKKRSLSRALELVARTRVPDGPKKGRRWWTAMALGLAEAAASGDAAAFKAYADRVEGPVDRDPESSGPPQIVVNLISIAPQKPPIDAEIIVTTEAVGKTN